MDHTRSLVPFRPTTNTIALSFVFYTLAIVAFGVYSARFAERTSADFFLAGRGENLLGHFDWNYRAGVLAGAAVVLIYTTVGGLRAVDWTDVAQATLIIAALMAAVASTADSQLLVVAASISHDLLKRVFGKRGSEHSRILLHRATVFAFGVVASLIALTDNRTIFHFVLYVRAGRGAGIGPGLILSLLWRRTTG